MHQQQPGAHEVERLRAETVGEEVVAADLDAVARERLQEAGVDIQREHAAGRTDALCQHP